VNIFVLSSDPAAAAGYLCNKHVVKMPVETAQMLCSAHSGPAPYKKTHVNHPCSIWARTSICNYQWLCEHGMAICDVYRQRYGRTHASQAVIEWCMNHVPSLDGIALTAFVQAMPEKYKSNICVIRAYRDYYFHEKRHFAVWPNNDMPFWMRKRYNDECISAVHTVV
jgi:hypothetical protein